MPSFPDIKNLKPIHLAAVIFAIAPQAHTTTFKAENYEGLKVSLADLLLPIAGVVILASLLLKRSRWPSWKKPFGWWAPLLLSAVMTAAFINGYFIQGEVSQWALINKLGGWFALMAYLCASAWFITNYGDHFLKIFLTAFFAFFVLTVVGEIAIQLFKGMGIQISARKDSQSFEGFMDNRNAFAFLFVSMAGLISIYKFKSPSWVLYFFWILAPIVFFFSASRTLWICGALLVLFFALYDWKKVLRVIVPCVAIGTLLFFTMFSKSQVEYFAGRPVANMMNAIDYAKQPNDPEIQDAARRIGNKERLEILSQAFDLIKAYPLFGAGLGSTLYFQQQETGSILNIIDNTLIWLTAEAGIVGLLAFLGCYVVMLIAIGRTAGNLRQPQDLFALWVVVVMLCFGVFSLFHEILYTRFFWFALGLALAAPKTRQATPET